MQKRRDEIIAARKLVFKPTLKGDFVKFTQMLHDKIRCGEVCSLITPLTVFWAVTAQCNLRCVYCYANKDHTSAVDLTNSECISLIDELAELGVAEVVLEGGEPLIRNDILSLLSKLKNCGIIVTIITNGILLNPNFAREIFAILDPRYDTIQISLDGDPEVTDTARGHGVYRCVVDNLSLLKEARLFWENMIINCVITDQNFMLQGVMCKDLIEQTLIEKVHFTPVFPQGLGKYSNIPDERSAYKEFVQLKELYKGKLEFSGYFFPDRLLFKDPAIWDSITQEDVKLGCCAGRSKIFISSNGKCYPCTFVQYRKCEIGKFPEQSLSELWKRTRDFPYIVDSFNLSTKMYHDKIYMDYCSMYRHLPKEEE